MNRMIRPTRLVTMIAPQAPAVLVVGVAGTAFAVDPADGAAPAAKPLTTAASLAVTTPDDKASPDKKRRARTPG